MKEERKKVQKYKVSIVNYTNTLPFKYGMEETGFVDKIDLQYDIPSVCAQKVIEGKVDLGLIPVAVIPALKEFHIVSMYCLGSNDKVDTVKLYSTVPLNEIKEVYLDYQSRTSVSLVKVLAKFHWSIQPVFTDAKEGFEKLISGNTAAVVIGDRCFEMNGKFAYEFDLSSEWKKFTGMPFVFAAWISNKELDEDFVAGFDISLAYGVERIKEAVKKNIAPEKQELVTGYLTNRISYELDDKKQTSMEHFLHLLKQL